MIIIEVSKNMKAIFLFSIIVLIYIYYFYGKLLEVLALFSGKKNRYVTPDLNNMPNVTILVTVFNEEKIISKKIKNTLSLNYPKDKIEILFASDGSTDKTVDIIKNVDDGRIKLFINNRRSGKTGTQNEAIKYANGDIIVFTDAATELDRNCIIEIIKCFKKSEVGCVTGNLIFACTDNANNGEIARSQGYYWNYELKLRSLESKLGILAVATGACMAIRKNLFKEMECSIGEDCIIPLDIVLQGYKVIHCNEALAYDNSNKEGTSELKDRVRMTQRNWQGTFKRGQLFNLFTYPGYTFSLFSHKILRWLSPYFILIATISWFYIAKDTNYFRYLIMPVLLIYGLGIWGLLREIFPKLHKLYMSGFIYSFFIANLGFFVGVLKAITGIKTTIYRK